MSATVVNKKPISKLSRYEKVFSTFIKYGFEDILSHPPFNKLFPQTSLLVPKRNGKKVSQFTRVQRIRMVCEELGTTFIKFAQIASNRPDLLPEELISELEILQDQAPVVPEKEIINILRNDLPRPLEEMVSFFDYKPLASASMAQVHRATLIGGKEVVLKIQRPGIKQLVAADLSILKSIVSIIENFFPKYNIYQPRELVKMFEQSITDELSFKIEAKNLIQFQEMFLENENVCIPDIYQELCTDNILCMAYVDGHKITDLKKLSAANISGKTLALKGIGLYFEQVFEHGLFHADPHPGNIFVLNDGRIAFIDFGMVGIVIESDKILFAKILLAMYNKDGEALKKAIMKFSSGLDKDQQRNLEYDINYFLRHYSAISIEDIDGNEVMKGLNSLFFDYKIKIPANLLLLLKALIIIEGVGLKLDPEYDIIQNIGPYVKRLIEKKIQPF
ncbi:MAG: phosphotransferase [Bacteroidia bacterium]|nr:phosphotransferase [Bacteroidia bacterium]